MNLGRITILLAFVGMTLVSCRSIERAAVRSVADMLSGTEGSSAFTGDEDPQLVGDALPLALKLYEIILDKDPKNDMLAAATGKIFVMYSGAFVQMPADMLPDDEWEKSVEGRQRAKKLFRRGRDYLLAALEMRHEGFRTALELGSDDEAIAMLDENDADAAYWAALGWLGMASTNPFDMELLTTLDKAAVLLYRSLALDETNAGIHDVLIQLQLTLPDSILINARERSPATALFIDEYYRKAGVGKDKKERALFHYNKAVSLSNGNSPSPYLTMATALAVKEQDVEAYRYYLDKALSIDPEATPDDKLMVIIYQKKAKWLLEHIEDYFLVDF